MSKPRNQTIRIISTGVYFNVPLICCVIVILSVYSSSVMAQPKNEPDENQLIQRSMSQLVAALSIKKGLADDPTCINNKYGTLSVDNYIDWIKKIEEKKPNNAKMTSAQQVEIKEILSKMVEAPVPDKGVMWRQTYEFMKKEIQRQTKIGDGESCDRLNTAAENLYRKSIDSLRSLK